MKIPLYSQLKLKLESKGIDSITSGQIAWFVASAIVSFIIGFFCSLFFSANFNSFEAPRVFLFALVFIFFFSWSILTFIHRKFMPLGLCFTILYLISVFVKNATLLLIGAFIIILFWFLYNKSCLRIKLLLCAIFLIFGSVWFILFFFFTHQVILR